MLKHEMDVWKKANVDDDPLFHSSFPKLQEAVNVHLRRVLGIRSFLREFLVLVGREE